MITKWSPRTEYRGVERSGTRWADVMANMAGQTRTRLAWDRGERHKNMDPAVCEFMLYTMLILRICFVPE